MMSTAWLPYCYIAYQNFLPAPVVTFADAAGVSNVYIAPNSVAFINGLGSEYTSLFQEQFSDFDWEVLAGAQVLEIEGMDPWSYADLIADTETGNYLDHGVRVANTFSTYRIQDTDYSQRFGDIAGPVFPDKDNLSMTLILVNATENTTVTIPFISNFQGYEFTDQASL